MFGRNSHITRISNCIFLSHGPILYLQSSGSYRIVMPRGVFARSSVAASQSPIYAWLSVSIRQHKRQTAHNLCNLYPSSLFLQRPHFVKDSFYKSSIAHYIKSCACYPSRIQNHPVNTATISGSCWFPAVGLNRSIDWIKREEGQNEVIYTDINMKQVVETDEARALKKG